MVSMEEYPVLSLISKSALRRVKALMLVVQPREAAMCAGVCPSYVCTNAVYIMCKGLVIGIEMHE